MTGPDFQKVNETKTAETDAARMTAFVAGAHEVDAVEPDGGELATAMAYLATVADAKT